MKRSPENPSESSKAGNDDQGSFLNRWSQRKRDASVTEEDALTEEGALDKVAISDGDKPSDAIHPKQLDSLTEPAPTTDSTTPILTDADMPDIESLNGDSDFSPFLSEGVSKELRNRALKKLFFSGKFAVRDGLDDYDDDFTYFEPLGDTVTSDMKFHQRRKEKARLAELEAKELEAAELEASELEVTEDAKPEEQEPAETALAEADDAMATETAAEPEISEDAVSSESTDLPLLEKRQQTDAETLADLQKADDDAPTAG